MPEITKNKLCLGSANFSMEYGITNKTKIYTLSELRNLLKFAVSSGITMIDTARTYGKTEKRLGRADVRNFDIITKIKSINSSHSENAIKVFIECSKRDLWIDKLYGLLLHSPNELLGNDGEAIANGLRRVRDQGIVQKVGLSIYGPENLDLIIKKFKPDIVQAPYNIFDQRLLISGWAERLKTMGVEVHLRSVFLQGLLLLHPKKLPKKFEIWEDAFLRWYRFQQESNSSATDLALGHCLSQKWADKIIVGVDSISQLEELVSIKQLDIKLPQIFKSKLTDTRIIDPSTWMGL